jgi:hypothetical protein
MQCLFMQCGPWWKQHFIPWLEMQMKWEVTRCSLQCRPMIDDLTSEIRAVWQVSEGIHFLSPFNLFPHKMCLVRKQFMTPTSVWVYLKTVPCVIYAFHVRFMHSMCGFVFAGVSQEIIFLSPFNLFPERLCQVCKMFTIPKSVYWKSTVGGFSILWMI